MRKESSTANRYQKAQKRVKELKGFYNHLKIFAIVNTLLYLVKSGALNPLMPKGFPTESYYFDWIHINFLIWGLMIVAHALILYRHKLPFLKKWEEKQIQKYIEKDKQETEK
ncbi:2TM domain-containing protein [uncultured Croceitalea sp.]|uniref:2TM domain-containing protein n=1 Tax=uncultured Croceitalea sp. TaxID=1798908 RepID=UPI00374EAEF3